MHDHFPFVTLILFGICLALSATDLLSAQQDINAPVLGEVIGTAEKRGAENLQNLAMSAAVISSVSYQEHGAGRTTVRAQQTAVATTPRIPIRGT